MTIQDIIDAGIELYFPIIKVWDEKQQSYVESVMFDGNDWKKYRDLPIKYIYATPRSRFYGYQPKLIFEVAINKDGE